MEVVVLLIKIIEAIIFVYLGIASVYFFIYAFAGIFPIRHKKEIKDGFNKFAILIPGYKEDTVIIDVAKDALLQDYPKDKFEVVVIADSFKESTLEELKKLSITLIEVSFEKSTKAKALTRAMDVLGDEYDVALILDADNLIEKDFTSKMNLAFNRGYKAVQGHRIAKNTNTAFAILDAVSEEVNNHIFRKGHRVLNMSCGLIGSGMAFDYKFFKTTMNNVFAVGGFDKELELKLSREKIMVEYLPHAYCLDEKVQDSGNFSNQRRRWLSAQVIYLRRYFFSGIYHLLAKGNLVFFDKMFQMLQPPRILLLGFVTLLTLVHGIFFILGESLFNTPFITFFNWLVVFCLVYFSFMLAVPRKFYNKETLKAVLTLPKGFILMFISLITIKGANKKFIHTQHGTVNDKS
ncbi:Glycosyltransferase, catalytic subunit of cellulose synthase and poly-beta-1,6-N-acetylglucosamine synthase [Draconibacterium orientale]|uniref:Glycosyl transferase family 2 n=1 Tax=Draconibacterium orientale TaxID=1168034 RepID=X5DJE2_9BACT|nr:glycosyltransferase family 2 protein [Draconibacterium orientale]AHW61239.1 glycosyl transferase family 2 [Draconibacterium orientale]SET94913.1 Glycosyltransferase, catalytic subunit of cellulose synthase and poly-beta-1,6-N-acetylglucosamine synthase [Draconibacterium orientale]